MYYICCISNQTIGRHILKCRTKNYVLNIRVDEETYDYLMAKKPKKSISKRVRHLIELDKKHNLGELNNES